MRFSHCRTMGNDDSTPRLLRPLDVPEAQTVAVTKLAVRAASTFALLNDFWAAVNRSHNNSSEASAVAREFTPKEWSGPASPSPGPQISFMRGGSPRIQNKTCSLKGSERLTLISAKLRPSKAAASRRIPKLRSSPSFGRASHSGVK